MDLRRLLAPLLALAFALVLAGRAAAQAAPAAGCPPAPLQPDAMQLEAGLRAARDRGFLWEVRRAGDEPSYLYGTVHAARRDWMFPGPRVRAALLASDTLALELDLLDADIQRRMTAALAAAEPSRLTLSPALQQRIAARALADCVAPELLARLGPEMQVVTLTLLAARREGLEAAYGIDLFLAGFARGLGRPVVSLETPEQQVRALLAGSRAEALALIDSGLAELESGRARTLLARIAGVWAESDHADLLRYPEWCDCRRTPTEVAALRRLLDDRNPALADGIDALLRRGARVFAAVGSLHLVGPNGVPALLAQRGYQVERIALETPPLDIPALWDFADPARSEAVFRERLAHEQGDAALSLRTQIARTYSLRGRYAEAHALLDAVDAELPGAGPEPKVRALLERGRTWRSSGQPERALPLFRQALTPAARAGLEFLAIDAMHMIALAEPGLEAQLDWNRRALAGARVALDPRARDWDASLEHNIGMSLHEAGRHEEALVHLRAALVARERIGNAVRTQEARWAVAWGLRALRRHDEALAMLLPLEREQAAAGTPDGFVAEEIAENLLATGAAERARPYFARAHALLVDADPSERPDPQRLARMLALSR